jgi:hypothetical protein
MKYMPMKSNVTSILSKIQVLISSFQDFNLAFASRNCIKVARMRPDCVMNLLTQDCNCDVI